MYMYKNKVERERDRMLLTHTHARTHARTHTRAHTHTHTHTHTQLNISLHMCIYYVQFMWNATF